MLALADVHLAGSPAGVAFAVAAGVLWAGYIVLGHRMAADPASARRTGSPPAMAHRRARVRAVPRRRGRPRRSPTRLLLAACLAVGLSSSVVPYALEQVAMRRLPRARFALLLALLPATAAIVGAVILGQVPRPLEAAGIALVVAAVAAAHARGIVTSHGRSAQLPPADG